MRRFLGFVLALVVFLTPRLHADQWADTVKATQSAVVYVENSEGSCTGFVINTAAHLVLTAAHCDAKDGDVLWVDHVKGTVIAKDSKKDLLVLQVPFLDSSHTALALAPADPTIREDVMSVGYGYGLERPQFKTAHVSDTVISIPDGGPFIGVDASFTPGQSGGPVVDVQGRVVMIVQRGDGGTLGLGVGADVIRASVGRFFAQGK